MDIVDPGCVWEASARVVGGGKPGGRRGEAREGPKVPVRVRVTDVEVDLLVRHHARDHALGHGLPGSHVDALAGLEVRTIEYPGREAFPGALERGLWACASIEQGPRGGNRLDHHLPDVPRRRLGLNLPAPTALPRLTQEAPSVPDLGPSAALPPAASRRCLPLVPRGSAVGISVLAELGLLDRPAHAAPGPLGFLLLGDLQLPRVQSWPGWAGSALRGRLWILRCRAQLSWAWRVGDHAPIPRGASVEGAVRVQIEVT